MSLVQAAIKEVILIQYLSYSIDTAAFLIPVLIEEIFVQRIRFMFGLFMAVSQMFVFFWFANVLQVESAEICHFLYNENDWLKCDKDQSKLLQMMMTMSQRRLVLKAVAVGEMDIGCFTKMMRLCYSIVTFFFTVYTK
ncbi:unnamed protein product [Acanthoscelides obtectus]|uniref:Uncharacterized protein n=1 Tax=Acanthoscelides obtectus TaxID=200917 RepID=A0A9P0LAC5_ACAOB|nr:unnamed protein product [Acanthoscelides obtectus]CAK1638311.1 Odorant receptor Or2 [Acanthoscelides obtectus]